MSLTVLLTLGACQNSTNLNQLEVYEGILAFKLVDINFDFLDLPYDSSTTYYEHFENLDWTEIGKDERQIKEAIESLKSENLIGWKSFRIKFDTSKQFSRVYIRPDQYLQFQYYNLNKLRESEERVKVKFRGYPSLQNGIICEELISVIKEDGETTWGK